MKKTNQITRKDSEKSRDTARKLLTLLVACVLSSAVYFWAASVETLWKPAIIGFLVAASVVFIVYFEIEIMRIFAAELHLFSLHAVESVFHFFDSFIWI